MIGFLLGMPLVSMAQRGWSVVVQATPLAEQTNYPRRVFYPDSNGQVVEPIYLNGSHWAPGVQVGLVAQYGFAPGWSVGAGVGYRQFSTRQTRFSNDGTTVLNSRAVRVPVLLNFQSTTNRLSPYFSAGTLLDFPLSSRVTVRRTDQPVQQLTLGTEGGPVVYLTAGAGGRYQLSDHSALVVQPVLTHKIGRFGASRSHNPAVEVGVQAEVSYSF